jgi:enoyl-[acyl-carrier-protein] reductase (NADH)
MAKVPMNRMGVPEEIAEAVVWMCSDKASFMTGASQVVDGGYYAAYIGSAQLGAPQFGVPACSAGLRTQI